MNKKLPPWLWVVLAIFLMYLFSKVGDAIEQKRAPSQAVIAETTPTPLPEKGAKPTPKPTPQPTPDLSDGLTMEERNALKSAQSYLKHSSFSEPGLIHQLVYEGFTEEAAAAAVAKLSPDWNAQAEKSARSYLKHSSFSEAGLLHQLDYEGFTPEQARFGVDHSGADWFAEAAEAAASYLKHSSFSRDGLYHQLEYEGFTPDQIEFALADVGY